MSDSPLALGMILLSAVLLMLSFDIGLGPGAVAIWAAGIGFGAGVTRFAWVAEDD